jgi:uncharacterized membrane protein YeaQ/YmgE (transglycosylase-associated protein family)
MPNRAEHVSAAVPVGIAFSLYKAHGRNQSGILWEALGGGVGAVAGALLPDLVDVPSCPNHRAMAHGFATAGVLAYGAWKYLDDLQDSLRAEARQHALEKLGPSAPSLALWHGLLEIFLQILAGALAGFVAGYISHIALDFGTPRSIPLVR